MIGDESKRLGMEYNLLDGMIKLEGKILKSKFLRFGPISKIPNLSGTNLEKIR